jgi:hypothetical protein
MQLTVDSGPAASAEAAAYVYVDCSRRSSTGSVRVNGTYRYPTCGQTVGTGGNSVSHAGDHYGPSCIYYGTTLAGCVGKGYMAYVGNRSGYTARLVFQPIGS